MSIYSPFGQYLFLVFFYQLAILLFILISLHVLLCFCHYFLMSTFTQRPMLFWMDLPLLSSLSLISIFSNTSLPRDCTHREKCNSFVVTFCSIVVFHCVNLTMVMLHVFLFFAHFFTLYYVVFHLLYERKLKAC